MPDDQSERIIKLLEEIRDLTMERNGKFDEYIRIAKERNDKYEEALKRVEVARKRALRLRRWFQWTAIPLLLLGVGIMIYVGLWVIPRSEEQDYNEQMDQYRMIQNHIMMARPH